MARRRKLDRFDVWYALGWLVFCTLLGAGIAAVIVGSFLLLANWRLATSDYPLQANPDGMPPITLLGALLGSFLGLICGLMGLSGLFKDDAWDEAIADLEFDSAQVRWQITRMTIRARVAFGLLCAERVCKHLGLSGDQVDDLFTPLWSYTSDQNLESFGCCDSDDVIAAAGNVEVTDDDRQLLTEVLEELDEIASGNLYGGYRNEYTLRPTLALCQLLNRREIPLPPTRAVLQASHRLTRLGLPNLRNSAWGRPFDGSPFRERPLKPRPHPE